MHFLFRLAHELHRTVDELLATGLSAKEFAQWFAYFSLDAERRYGAGLQKFNR